MLVAKQRHCIVDDYLSGKSNYWTAINMIREQVTGLVTAQKQSSGKNHGLGGKSTNSACRLFATLRATKVAKITVILRGNTAPVSTVSSLSTGLFLYTRTDKNRNTTSVAKRDKCRRYN